MSGKLANPAALEPASAVWRTIALTAKLWPAEAQRASAGLQILLAPLQDSSWSFSPLTGDGFPVEFVFNTVKKEVRYTVDIGEAINNPQRRLEHAYGVLASLGVSLPSKDQILLTEIQRFGELSYGTWIGGRHDAMGDRYKLYVEVPGEHNNQPQSENRLKLDAQSLLPGGSPPQLRMLGYDIATSVFEYYFRSLFLEPWRLQALLARAGLQHRTDDLIEFIETLWDRGLHNEMPSSTMGFSYALDNSGEPKAFSLFMFARSMFGSDQRIRERLLALAQKYPWQLGPYELVSKPLAGRSSWKTYHGMIVFVVPVQGPMFIQIGLRPPG